MRSILLFVGPLLLPPPAGAQGADGAPPAAPAPTANVPASASAAARELWGRVGQAAHAGDAAPAPLSAFTLSADVLTREEAQTNEMKVDYRFLAPHYIRFRLPGGRETGRGPGVGRKSYWLRDGDEVVHLDGREDVEGRRLVDEMTSIARNYVVLSDPSRIQLTELSLLDAPPTGLPHALARDARKLVWLHLTSPDFALLESAGVPGASDAAPDAPGAAAAARPLYDVELGIASDTNLPAIAVVRPRDARRTAQAMLIQLPKYGEQEGFRLPMTLLVHRPDADAPRLPGAGAPFEEKPSQEIYVTHAELRPALTPESFAP